MVSSGYYEWCEKHGACAAIGCNNRTMGGRMYCASCFNRDGRISSNLVGEKRLRELALVDQSCQDRETIAVDIP